MYENLYAVVGGKLHVPEREEIPMIPRKKKNMDWDVRSNGGKQKTVEFFGKKLC
jgi:hypothetical protein